MRSVPFRCRLLGHCFWDRPYKGLTPNGPLKHKAFFQKKAWNFYDPAARKHINLSLWRSARPGPHHSIKELCDPIDLKYLKQGWSSKQFLFSTITQPLCVLALKHLLSVPLWCLTLESVTREQSSFIWNKLDSFSSFFLFFGFQHFVLRSMVYTSSCAKRHNCKCFPLCLFRAGGRGRLKQT